MPLFVSSFSVATILLLLVVGKVDAQLRRTTGGCADPIASILATLKCIEEADSSCAASGYDSMKFVKLHNGVDTKTTINGLFWKFAFDFSKFELDIDHQINVGHNKASIRYVEKITTTDKVSFGTFGSTSSSSEYPYSQTFYQHEHALITVNDDCRIILWDQYGDNKEQEDVSNAMYEIFQEVVCANPLVGAFDGCDKAEVDEAENNDDGDDADGNLV